jgi:uncharacterized protein (TIGR02246 family)
MRRFLVLLLLACCTASAAAPAAEPQSATKAEIRATLQKWINALSSGQGEKPVMALYAKDAILLATFAAAPLTTPAEIAAYFRRLAAMPDLGATVQSEKIDLFGDGAADTGLYTFHYREGGKEVRVPARFTFVYRRTPRGWIIVSHHSSVVPKTH